MVLNRRILLPTIGSAGDVHPIIGLGCGLRARGHRVTVITNPYFEARIRQAGLDFLPLGTAEAYEKGVANPQLWHPTKGFEFIARTFVLPQLRPLYHLLKQFSPEDTIIVAAGLAFGARLAQEKRGMPLITAHLQATMLRSLHQSPIMGPRVLLEHLPPALKRIWFDLLDHQVIDPVLLPELNDFRCELGLLPVKRVFDRWLHSPQRVLGLFPDWYAPPQPDWPVQTDLTGFVHYETDEKRPFPPGVAQFLEKGDPPILFTPGSAMQHGVQFFGAALEACQQLGRRGLFVSAHTEHIPANLPDSICYAPYLPFSQVLPRTAALVFHGGIGTTAQGLAAGIPMLVMPMSHDQPDNAIRLKRLGVGDYLMPGRFRGTAVARKLDHLLHSPEIAANSQKLAPLVNFEQALDKTCQLIETA
ncbi:MAG: glycosyltransferase [Ardenticatenaceae bacterium]|nr:glycosyltransferase [Ardenticatenaceae bacterium]MCB9445845.1 glycosyltransferase [Ardenticatenaceae bacterium]